MSKKKKYQHIVDYTVPLYGVTLVVATDIEEASHLGVDIDPNHGASVCIATHINGTKEVVAVFRPDHMGNDTVAHEATHAAWRILDLVGITVDSDNHEALAYLVGWCAHAMFECRERTTKILAEQENTASSKE